MLSASGLNFCCVHSPQNRQKIGKFYRIHLGIRINWPLFRSGYKTGLFYWRVSRGGMAAGAEAGSPTMHGYRAIAIDGFDYSAHRLAWLYVYGEHPTGQVDHANGNRADNRIANLRDSSRRQSARNRWRRNRSGFKGVSRGRDKWRARIMVDGAAIHLGTFSTPQEAAAEYDKAARLHHGDFARTNAQIAAERAADASEQLRSVSQDEIIQSEPDPAQSARFESYQHDSDPRR
jgi:hypothetical protein